MNLQNRKTFLEHRGYLATHPFPIVTARGLYLATCLPGRLFFTIMIIESQSWKGLWRSPSPTPYPSQESYYSLSHPIPGYLLEPYLPCFIADQVSLFLQGVFFKTQPALGQHRGKCIFRMLCTNCICVCERVWLQFTRS